MTHTYEELKKKTVAQLREIAAGSDHEAVHGFTQLNKEHLLVALCKAFGIEMHKRQEVKGINKAAIKAKIKDLKKRRNEVLTAHNRAELKLLRNKIHKLKRKIHKATV